MGDNKAQLRALTRELANQAAQLQRETQRRAALTASYSNDTQMVKQLTYMNRKLDSELQILYGEHESIKMKLQEAQCSTDVRLEAAQIRLHAVLVAFITLKAAVKAHDSVPEASLERINLATAALQKALEQLAAPLTDSQIPIKTLKAVKNQQQQRSSTDADNEVLQLRAQVKSLTEQLAAAKLDRIDPATTRVQQQPNASAIRPNNKTQGISDKNIVDSTTTYYSPAPQALAVRELEAIIPQYKAAASALQGHAEVLKAQLTAANREKEALTAQVEKWKDAAEKNESLYADTAAKLHGRDAHSLTELASLREKCDDLEQQLLTATNRCTALETELEAAMKFEVGLEEKERLCTAQSDTIARLERTIREQQQDIVAALSLASSSSSKRSDLPHGGSATIAEINLNGGHSQKGEDDILLSADFTHEDGLARGWSIPAGANSNRGGERGGGDGVGGSNTIVATEILSLKDALKQALHELKE